MTLLTKNEIEQAIMTIPVWACSEDMKHITRSITFNDFTAAFAFMKNVAIEAERLNHHPYWKNEYNKVEISLTTHDADGLTELDFQLARSIDSLL